MSASDRIFIQAQDITGDWKNITTTIRSDQVILRNIDAVQKSTKKLVRAVDQNGNIVQLGKNPD